MEFEAIGCKVADQKISTSTFCSSRVKWSDPSIVCSLGKKRLRFHEVKKKVKDVHHAKFKVGNSEGGSSRWHQEAWGLPKRSFKDKLVGEIPGAFAKAFEFTDVMEEEAESDDEMLDLREGLATVKLSKETKMRIRSPWALTLIIKPFGKAVGFNFLQNKLNLLWKPSGRIDLVMLGHGFYSVHFTLKEDLNVVLDKGPWFIGGHFLALGHGNHSLNQL
nr:hypothetical protein CFP56_64309 [Quercus suber]